MMTTKEIYCERVLDLLSRSKLHGLVCDCTGCLPYVHEWAETHLRKR